MALAHKIPLSSLFLLVLLLAAGELATGTNLYFVTMVAMAMTAAGITYNMLGGLSTMSGIAFSMFAINGLVIGQFAKVLLAERADRGLMVPNLTITVYTVFYVSLMVGVFLFGWMRLRLPQPMEPTTPRQSRLLYLISLALGLPGSVLFLSLNLAGPDAVHSAAHGLALALMNLLPFSLVVAVDDRIRSTDGRHCFGWLALWPVLGMVFLGFVIAGRASFVEPALIILITCYTRGYRLRRRHYTALVVSGVFFFTFISPYYLFVRQFRGEGTLSEETAKMFRHLLNAPGEWQTIKATISESTAGDSRAWNYFSHSGTETLNRFALIAPDSALINSCSNGFHYGFKSIEMDILSQVPHFLYKNKPEFGSGEYLGQIDGLEPQDVEGTTYSTITSVADTFGAFGWLSVILFPMIVLPLILVTFESIFDMSRPWGTVAVVALATSFGTLSIGSNLVLAMKLPLSLLLISWVLSSVAGYLCIQGDERPMGRRDEMTLSLRASRHHVDGVNLHLAKRRV